jgi:CDGSH-type Zn-finger protein
MLSGFYQPTRVKTSGSVTIAGMASTKVTVNNNGSIRIEGDFSMHDAAGKEFGLGGRSVISLCRCGHSANKPFCDGSHKGNAFDSVCEARDLPPKV